MKLFMPIMALGLVAFMATGAQAAPIYLNDQNITVAYGPRTSSGTMNNTVSINNVIDAPSADATEVHNQNTHVWFTALEPGGGLELLFDFGLEIDISILHFWNYTSEDFDVDNIAFTFFNGADVEVGSLLVEPALGSSPGIAAEDIPLVAPLNVQFVTAFLTGTNGQVDFQNIGFTGEISTPVQAVAEPATLAMFGAGLLVLAGFRRRFGPND